MGNDDNKMDNNIEKFLEFENQNNLLEYQISGLRFWLIIRENLYNDILKKSQGIGVAHTTFSQRSRTDKIKIAMGFFKNAISNNLFSLKQKDILVINHPRRVKNGMYYECLYTDYILENLPHTYYVLEDTSLNGRLTPVRTQNLMYTDSLNFRFFCLFYIRKIRGGLKLQAHEEKYIRDLIAKVGDVFNVNFDPDSYISKIKDQLLKYIILYNQYEKIISKVNPKLIVEVVSYERRRKAINAVAKKLNIPTVEFQHGTMGKYHIAYNFSKKSGLPTFPDFVFTYGQFWKDKTRLPIDDSKVKVVGWPYYERKVNEYKSKRNEIGENVILFISQGPVGKELSKVAVELSERITKGKYKIIYKLHPGEYARWKEEYPWLTGKDIAVIDNNEYDMHYYFSQADIQIGVSSTALFEGLGYGLATYIYKVYSHEYMEDLYGNNLATLIQSVDELLENLENRTNYHSSYDAGYFWEKNSMNNAMREINTIIGDSNLITKVEQYERKHK